MEGEARRAGEDVARELRHQEFGEEVGAGEDEAGGVARGVEGAAAGEEAFEVVERRAERRAQRGGEVGGDEALALPDEERIAEGEAEAGEGG